MDGGGGMCSRVCVAGGACMVAQGHVWQGGSCMAVGMHGRGCAWQGGHGRGMCAGDMATGVGGMHPTGMHSVKIKSSLLDHKLNDFWP